jgi:hypothetical protein
MTAMAAQFSRATLSSSNRPIWSSRVILVSQAIIKPFLLIHIFLRVYDDEKEPIKELKCQLFLVLDGDIVSFAYTLPQSCGTQCAREPRLQTCEAAGLMELKPVFLHTLFRRPFRMHGPRHKGIVGPNASFDILMLSSTGFGLLLRGCVVAGGRMDDNDTRACLDMRRPR